MDWRYVLLPLLVVGLAAFVASVLLGQAVLMVVFAILLVAFVVLMLVTSGALDRPTH
jgi:hypothetical protein